MPSECQTVSTIDQAQNVCKLPNIATNMERVCAMEERYRTEKNATCF